MELLVTLRDKSYMERMIKLCDGFIVGSLFSSGYNFSKEDLIYIKDRCKEYDLKFYIVIDNFISEDDKTAVLDYLYFIKKLDVDGIYVHDLGLYDMARIYELDDKLIYDGQTVMCNSLDVSYFMSKGFDGVVLSRELTFKELIDIVRNNPNCCDVQVFGHTRLSYSKRKFITNYFKELKLNYDFTNKDHLYITEEQRDYRMPIVEDESGTKIYSDYILQMYREIPLLKHFIKRAIVDTMFIDYKNVINVLRDYRFVDRNNAEMLFEKLKIDYPNNYSTGFLYQKTNITKDE